MRLTATIIISILTALSPATAVTAKGQTEARFVDVIVTLAGNPSCNYLPENYVFYKSAELDMALRDATAHIEDSVRSFIEQNCTRLIDRVDQVYGMLMRGFACRISEPNLTRLKAIPGVSRVVPSPSYQLFDTMADSPKVTRSEDAWKMKDFKGNPVTGNGQVIGVIDTGLDWRHPALGGKFGANARVVNGIDYSTGKGIEIDPQSHGTSVAGAAAGNGKYKGSAPDAKLVGFKVYPESEGGGGTNVGANILKAVEQSVALKCTVLNLSLGSAGGGSGEEDVADPYRNAIKAGVVICAAAGNNGARSDSKGFQVASPSTIPQVISCAATDDTKHLTLKLSAPESHANVSIGGNPFDNPEIWPAGDYEVVDCGYGSQGEFAGVDAKGKIALIKRGPIGAKAIRFKDKALEAKQAGAVGCIIYNHSLSSFNGTMYASEDKDRPELVPAIAITYTQGYKLKNLVGKGLRVSVVTGQAFGMMTDFSSMGPSTDLKFKPEVAAPGLGVMSPSYMGLNPDPKNAPYTAFSGTSCATPVISGVAALVRQYCLADPPQAIKCRLMSTASLLFNSNANEYIPLMLQGSGRVDARKAMTTKHYFNPPSLSLVAVDNSRKTKVTIVNLSKDRKRAVLSYWSLGRNTTCRLPDMVDLEPSGETTFDVEVSCDPDAEGVHEGIIFAKINDDEIHIPLIFSNGPVSVKNRISDLRISRDSMDFSDPKIPSITFRINFGDFEPNTPGRDVTNNFAAGKIDLYNDEGLLGTVMMDDSMQVGYYNIHWDGHDYLDRLFAPDGNYTLKAVGMDTLVDGDTMTIRNQADPPSVNIRIVNSPVLQMPLIKMKTVPSRPNMDEPFEMRFHTSYFNKVTSASATFRWDPVFFSIDKISEDTAFGKPRPGLVVNSNINNDKGIASVEIILDKDFAETSSGFLFSMICNPKQDGKCDYSLTGLGIVTLDGGYSPKEYEDFLFITNTFSRFDLNNDTIVDELDADLLKKYLWLSNNDARYREHLDFDLDGHIDANDMLMLAKMFGFRKSPP